MRKPNTTVAALEKLMAREAKLAQKVWGCELSTRTASTRAHHDRAEARRVAFQEELSDIRMKILLTDWDED